MLNAADFNEQYDALRRGAGFVELEDWTSVSFTGADRQKFLNSFCTNDINRLAPGQGCEAFVTNVKGRTIGFGYVDCRDDELVLITVPNQAATLVAHFDRYIIREDVQIRDTSDERVYFHANILPETPSARWIGWRMLKAKSGALLEVGDDDVLGVRQYLRERQHVPCGQAAFESLRIETGTPLFGVDFNDQNFPQEVNRDREAISFTKGCYLGQETVARIDALGHVNQSLVGVRIDGTEIPAAGTELKKESAQVGQVTSAAYSPELRAPLALAMVRREANAVGTRLESYCGTAEVTSLPLAVHNE
jgi:folate-binding protein YgfZ